MEKLIKELITVAKIAHKRKLKVNGTKKKFLLNYMTTELTVFLSQNRVEDIDVEYIMTAALIEDMCETWFFTSILLIKKYGIEWMQPYEMRNFIRENPNQAIWNYIINDTEDKEGAKIKFENFY